MFANNEVILNGALWTDEGLSSLSKTVISYLADYYEAGIVTVEKRNEVLKNFIVRVYDHHLLEENVVDAVNYVHAAQLVWAVSKRRLSRVMCTKRIVSHPPSTIQFDSSQKYGVIICRSQVH